MKYDRLGGLRCALFLFWESQCGGELGQLVLWLTFQVLDSLSPQSWMFEPLQANT